jgi:hypothetical protein
VECVMLRQLSEEIAECYLRAEQARLQAKQAHDPIWHGQGTARRLCALLPAANIAGRTE